MRYVWAENDACTAGYGVTGQGKSFNRSASKGEPVDRGVWPRETPLKYKSALGHRPTMQDDLREPRQSLRAFVPLHPDDVQADTRPT